VYGQLFIVSVPSLHSI